MICCAAVDSTHASTAKLHEFDETMGQVISRAKTLRDDVHQAAHTHGVGLDEVLEKLSSELAIIFGSRKNFHPLGRLLVMKRDSK
jgi:hypothetical protein